ncbi:hypothetical protein LWE69_24900 [Paenibacillus sp. UKAQ_18]|uniref:Uncharacterized protein n=1 Tax=Paenibacillus polymyxa TaxID=1406 RepID=A0AAE9PR60_PAEPO|nr:hypothetical protein [Paenibacillus sp. UKAQ_18]MCP3778515.1 hypothetical protein [Paenibacillus sp. MZ03-122A]
MIDNADVNNRFQAKAGRILPAFFVLNGTPNYCYESLKQADEIVEYQT